MMRPCGSCPFRREGFLRLRAGDAARLADFILQGDIGLCHARGDVRHHNEACRGAQIFVAGGSAVIFASKKEMVAAHRQSKNIACGTLVDID